MNSNFYSGLSIVYLVPILLMHFITNTMATGIQADIASLMFGATIVMIGFSALPWIGDTIGFSAAKAKPVEYIFNGALVLFCVASFSYLHNINVTSTGLPSMFALVWEWLSVVVGLVAFLAFWSVKGEQIKHAVLDDGEAAPARNPTKRPF